MTKHYCVYIVTNQSHSVLYLGRTENLARRMYEHRNGLLEGFSKKYNTHKLVYVEVHTTAEDAAQSEWKMKKWRREWKENIINKQNPDWKDLYESYCAM